MASKEDNRTTIRLPPVLQEKLRAEVEERGMVWEDRGDIVIAALSEHYINKDPERRKDEIIHAFRDRPEVLKDLIQQVLSESLGRRPSS